MTSSRETPCTFVPPYLLERLGEPRAVAVDAGFRARRERVTGIRPPGTAAAAVAWTVHSAGNRETLPGEPVRTPGSAESGDVAVDEAAAGIAATLEMYAAELGRASYDGAGAMVSLSVHYGTDYVNAFWDGTQLVFGDGDRKVFDRFTKPVDVLAHEFAHAVTEHTAGLVYRDQPGALNESVSDAFAACLKQRVLGQDAAAADWLIGEGLFLPGVNARALRDMRAPGTAYDDPALGRDPQPDHMDRYVETDDDNGGVHLNSGIPNRAFALAATAIGGSSVAGAGRIWYAALVSDAVGPTTDFAGFAAATVAAAGKDADAVAAAWAEVGVRPGTAAPTPAPGAQAPAAVVRVRRSGGFAGITTTGEAPLDDAEVRDLVSGIDLAGVRGGQPRPDMFVYTFEIGDQTVSVPEQHLTAELARLAGIVLDRDDR